MDLENRYKTEDYVAVTKEVFRNRYPSDQEKAVMLTYYKKAARAYRNQEDIDGVIGLNKIANSFLYSEIKSQVQSQLNQVESYVKFAGLNIDPKTFRAEFDHENNIIEIYKNEKLELSIRKPSLSEIVKSEIKLQDFDVLLCFLGVEDKKTIYNAYVMEVIKANNLN
jgi:hypothetical protein